MIEMQSKHGEVIVYARTVENEAISQIVEMANSPLGENAHIRIMPDCCPGKGCVVGTTMRITDKVCPNLVGVDIGCGVDLVKTDIDFAGRLEELDAVIRKHIPYGKDIHEDEKEFDFSELLCFDSLQKDVKKRASNALGTLGGGNHFIEAYKDGYLAVHSGSRNIGLAVGKRYQALAEKRAKQAQYKDILAELQHIEPRKRDAWLKEQESRRVKVSRNLCFLTGEDMANYLHDVAVMQRFANANRFAMLNAIVSAMGGRIEAHINSIHNYIDMETMTLRKGAISAREGEILVIPLNMRDGMLICKGKGNDEWNCSAPHGAGRLYSRAMAKELFTVEEYADTMKGIFTTCVNENTLDEAPFVYKDYEEIMECIEPTVEILERIVPIFNFKAN